MSNLLLWCINVYYRLLPGLCVTECVVRIYLKIHDTVRNLWSCFFKDSFEDKARFSSNWSLLICLLRWRQLQKVDYALKVLSSSQSFASERTPELSVSNIPAPHWTFWESDEESLEIWNNMKVRFYFFFYWYRIEISVGIFRRSQLIFMHAIMIIFWIYLFFIL